MPPRLSESIPKLNHAVNDVLKDSRPPAGVPGGLGVHLPLPVYVVHVRSLSRGLSPPRFAYTSYIYLNLF